MNETTLSAQIRQALESAGYWVERMQSGKAKVRRGYMQLCSPGTPDLLVVSPYGWLEVKVPGKKRNPDQIAWHARAKKLGIRVAVVTSAGDALAEVLFWKRTGGDAA